MLEYTWATKAAGGVAPLQGNLAWANGDTTGYGVHADFINGWDIDVLRAALNSPDCGIGSHTSRAMTDCPIFFNSWNEAAAGQCRPARGVLTSPDYSNDDLVKLKSLPGCNALWASGPKPTTCDPSQTALDVTPLTGVDGAYQVPANDTQSLIFPTTPGWSTVACVNNYQQSFPTVVSYGDTQLTVDSCRKSCQQGGFAYSAVGQIGSPNWNCLCSNDFDKQAAAYTPASCTLACPGNSTQICGGNYVLSVSYNPDSNPAQVSTVTTPAGARYMGCLKTADPPSTYTFSSSKMTIDTCTSACVARNASWAALSQGSTCECGTGSLSAWPFVPELGNCQTMCNGNSTQQCGSGYRSSMYNVTTADITTASHQHIAGWQGCYSPKPGQVALSGSTWSSNSMTQSLCVNGCGEMGFSQAAIANGNQCMCGNTAVTGQELPDSQCSQACPGNSTQVCGQGTNLDLYSTAGAATLASVGAQLNAGSSYMGCWTDNSGVLSDYEYSTASMTTALCQAACQQFKYAYAGLSNGNTCNCGNTLPASAQVVTGVSCIKPCAGSSGSMCGGSSAMQVYNVSSALGSSVGAVPSANSSSTDPTSNAAYKGCYNDNTPGLTAYSFSQTTMTNDVCRTSCQELGYSLAGTDGGQLCRCGNQWVGGSVLPSSSCNTPCGGDSKSMCGGRYTLSLWDTAGAMPLKPRPAGWVGCFGDQSVRTLGNWSYTTPVMTSTVCKTACAQQNYALAGTEGNQCYCGNTLTAQRVPQALCTAVCSGDSTETCGGSWKISIYNTTVTASAPAASSIANATLTASATSGISTSSPSTGSSTGSSVSLVCYANPNALSDYVYSTDWISNTICGTFCKARGFAYAGVTSNRQCRCGNTAPTLVLPATSCAVACTADSAEMCGTTNTMSTVKTADLRNADTSGFITNYNSSGYVGCFQDVGSSRLLPSYYFSSSSAMTQDLCAQNCNGLGYGYFGTETGAQCFCANQMNITSGGYQIADVNCQTACTGGGATPCGGNTRLSIYKTSAYKNNAAPVPSGNLGCYAAGTMRSAAPLTFAYRGITTSLCRQNCNIRGYKNAGLSGGSTCSCSNDALWGAQLGFTQCSVPCSGDSTQMCGGNNDIISLYDAPSAPALGDATTGQIGCFQDTNPSMLTQFQYSSNTMTTTYCQSLCTSRGYAFAGLAAGGTCYCAAQMPAATLLPAAACAKACSGASNQTCGDVGRFNLYNAKYVQAIASSASVASRSSSLASSFASSASLASTSSSLKAASITSTTIATITSKTTSSAAVSSVVAPSSATFVGPVTSTTTTAVVIPSTTAPVSEVPTTTPVASPSPTSEPAGGSSETFTSLATYTTTSGAESTLAPASATTTSRSSSAAQSLTTGNLLAGSTNTSAVNANASDPTSAGSSAVSSIRPTSSTTSIRIQASSTVSTSATAPSSSASAASTVPVSSDTGLYGCYSGQSDSFQAASMTCSTLTPQMCQIWCKANGYALSGVQDGNFCGCAKAWTGLKLESGSSCSSTCVGDNKQTCGGDIAFNVYNATTTVDLMRRDVEEDEEASVPARRLKVADFKSWRRHGGRGRRN